MADRFILFKAFRKELTAKFGEVKSTQIWHDAGENLRPLEAQVTEPDRYGKMLLPVAALYTALYKHIPEQALPLLTDYGTRLGTKLARIVHGFTSIPGVPRLLWKHAPKLMRSMSSPDQGYTRRIVSETDALVAVDILSCPVHDAAVRLGVPEAARMICAMDKAYMCGFRHIRYTRTTSVAEGDACCDYRLRYDETKP